MNWGTPLPSRVRTADRRVRASSDSTAGRGRRLHVADMDVLLPGSFPVGGNGWRVRASPLALRALSEGAGKNSKCEKNATPIRWRYKAPCTFDTAGVTLTNRGRELYEAGKPLPGALPSCHPHQTPSAEGDTHA